jgi:hypothetical protein
MDQYNELISTKDYLRHLLTTVGGHVDRIIASGFNASNGFNTAVSAALTVGIKATALGTMAHDVRTIFSSLNSLLLKDLKETEKKVEIDEEMKKLRTKFKLKVQTQISKDLSQRVKTTLNQHIVAPALKMVANKAVASATSYITDHVKNYLKNKMEDEYAKDAAKCMQDFEKFKGRTDLTEEEVLEKEVIVKKINNIKGGTSDPELYAKLVELDTPMGDVELEAASKLINQKITVGFKNLEHPFGSGEGEVDINLEENHFPNSKDGKPLLTQDCLLQSLKDKGRLPIDMTPEEFRRQIANIIVNDPDVRAFVADPRRKFYSDIGFYGGFKKNDEMDRKRRFSNVSLMFKRLKN